jgi:hypothetical protein
MREPVDRNYVFNLSSFSDVLNVTTVLRARPCGIGQVIVPSRFNPARSITHTPKNCVAGKRQLITTHCVWLKLASGRLWCSDIANNTNARIWVQL